MSGHVLTRGRLIGVRSITDGICAPAVTDALLTIATDGDERDLSVTPDVAAAIAAGGMLFADVELTLTRTDTPAPAVDERRRYLAELDRSTRLERALADAERTVRVLRAGHDDADALRAAIGREIDHVDSVANASGIVSIRVVMNHVADRLRAVVDGCAVERVDAHQRVVDQAGEGAGAVVGGQHAPIMAAGDGARQSRDGGAA